MILKEFALDLPYSIDEEKVKCIMNEKKCTFNEASKSEYEDNWKCKRRRFRLETRCITSMFERIIGEVRTENGWKILVRCVKDIKEEKIINLLGVITLQVKFDFNNFSTSSEYKKKEITLSTLYSAIKIIGEEKGWDLDVFEKAYLEIKENDYLNEWVWKKRVKNSNGKYSAEVFCQHGISNMDISIIFREKKGTEIYRKKIISELPDEFAYAKFLGELKWISDSEVRLINKKGDKGINVKLN